MTLTAKSQLRLALVAFFCLVNNAASASQDPATILKILKRQDELASSASLSLVYNAKTPTSDYTEKTKLIYSKNQCSVTIEAKNINLSTWTDDKYAFTVMEKTVTVEDRGNLQFHFNPDNPPRSLGPLYCEGRGLSKLTDVRFEGDTIVGKIRGLGCRALLDPKNDFVATKIEFFTPKNLPYYFYENENVKKDLRGFSYTSHSKRLLGTTRTEYTISNLETGVSDIGKRAWLPKDYSVSDQRVSPGIGYTYSDLLKYNNGKEPTPDELLIISVRLRGEFDVRRKSDKVAINNIMEGRKSAKMARIVTVAIGFIVSIGLFILGRRLFAKR